MMSKISSVKKAPVNLFLQTINKNLGTIILFLIFMLFLCPGYLFNQLENGIGPAYSNVIDERSRIFINISMWVLVLTTIMSLISCFINFGFLYSKKSVDLYFSLPIKRTSLLLTRFLASVIPVILTSAICYSLMGAVLLKYNIFWNFSHILLSFGLNVLSILGCCSLLMIFICCAGTIADLLISFFGLNIAVIIIAEILKDYFHHYLYGFGYNYGFNITDANPLIYILLTPTEILDGLDGIDISKQILKFIIYVLVVMAVSFGISLILFKKRKVEKCACAYAYKEMYYVCGLAVGIIGGYFVGMIFSDGNSNLSFWVFSIFGSLIATATYGLVSNRSMKKLKSSLILGGISYGITVLTILIISSGGIGYAIRVPLEKEISSATLSGDYSLEIDDPELIVDTHKFIVSNRPSIIKAFKGNNVANINTTDIRIYYELKNGDHIERDYNIERNSIKTEIAKLYKSNNYLSYIKKGFENVKRGDTIISGSIDYNQTLKYIDDKVTYQSRELSAIKIKKEIVENLEKAYIKDILELTPNELVDNSTRCYIYLETRNEKIFGFELIFNKHFKNTIDVVEQIKN